MLSYTLAPMNALKRSSKENSVLLPSGGLAEASVPSACELKSTTLEATLLCYLEWLAVVARCTFVGFLP